MLFSDIEEDRLAGVVVLDAVHERAFSKDEIEFCSKVAVLLSLPEALEKLKEQRFDLVVLDIRMPGMDGIETLNEIKKIDKDQHVILCSAYGEFKQDLSSWASDAYAMKSADARELKDTIKNILGA